MKSHYVLYVCLSSGHQKLGYENFSRIQKRSVVKKDESFIHQELTNDTRVSRKVTTLFLFGGRKNGRIHLPLNFQYLCSLFPAKSRQSSGRAALWSFHWHITFTQSKPSSSRRACWIWIYSILKNSLILRNTLVVGLRTGVNDGFGRVSHLNRLKTFITIIVWAWVRYIHRAFPFLKSYFVITQFYSEESVFASVSVHVDCIGEQPILLYWYARTSVLRWDTKLAANF